MKCYVCHEMGRDTDAIGICIVCGMGLCQEHLIKEEVPIWEGGYPFPRQRVKKALPRILCYECYNALSDVERSPTS